MLEKDPMWASMDRVNWIQSWDLNKAVSSSGQVYKDREEKAAGGAMATAERDRGVGRCEEKL